jgi:opacity protein-like surface antigen
MWRLVLVLVVSCPVSALAQTSLLPHYREWEITGFTGGNFIGEYHFPTQVVGSNLESTRTIGVDYGSGYQFGFRLTENVNDYWAADLEYSFTDQNVHFTNLSPDVPSLSVRNWINHINYNVVYLPFPRENRFRPYVGGGIGAIFFFIPGKSSSEAQQRGLQLDDSWRFLFNVGGGLKYLIIDQFAVVFDFKDSLSRLPSYGIPDSASVINGQFHPGVDIHGTLNNFQISIGANVQWDDFAFRRRSRRRH